MVGQLDGGQAYVAAGIAAGQRGLDLVVGGTRRVYAAADIARPRRFNDLAVGTSDPLVEETVFDSSPASANAGTVALVVPVAAVDPVRPHDPAEAERLRAGAPGRLRAGGFVPLLPRVTAARPEPAGGWPVAVFGPGVTRSKYDVFLGGREPAQRHRHHRHRPGRSRLRTGDPERRRPRRAPRHRTVLGVRAGGRRGGRRHLRQPRRPRYEDPAGPQRQRRPPRRAAPDRSTTWR